MAHQHVLRDVPLQTERAFARPTALPLASLTHVVLRAGTGLLFLEHGMQKLFGLLGGFGGTPGATAPLMSLMGLAGILEFGGGLLLVLGLLTRPVAIFLWAEMVYAFMTAHMPRGGWPIENGGELALLYAVIFAYLATHGSGPMSADHALGARSSHT